MLQGALVGLRGPSGAGEERSGRDTLTEVLQRLIAHISSCY